MYRHLYKLPAILYSILIFFLSSLPQSEIPHVRIIGFDKFLHFTEYLLYGMTLMLAYTRAKSPLVLKNAFTASVITGILYAVSDEIHQLFVVGRDCSIGDFSADALGVTFGVFLFLKIIRYHNPEDEILYQQTSHK